MLPQVGHPRLSFHSSVIAMAERLKAFGWYAGSVPDLKLRRPLKQRKGNTKTRYQRPGA
jgi:hypothetical protein